MNEVAYMKIIVFIILVLLTLDVYSQQSENENDSTLIFSLTSDTLLADSSLLIGKHHQFIPVDSLINYSKKFVGTPYRYGGRTESGFDCSGFVYYVFKNFGLILPPSSRSQVNAGEAVAIDSVRKGDLLFFKGRNIKSTQIGHVALVVAVSDTNDVQIIHSTRHGLKVEWLSEELYFKKRYLTSRRLDLMPQ